MNTLPDVAQMRSQFDRDGFIVLPDFLDAEQLAQVNAALDAHYEPLLESRTDTRPDNMKQFECEVIPWDPVGAGHPLFTALRDAPALETATEAVLGSGYTAPASLVMYSTPGGLGQAWHQDCPPENPDEFNLNRLLYVRDVAYDDGAIVVVPGSHRQGRISPGGNQEPIPGEVALTPAAGTLILLSGHVYHRVTPNLSGQPRVSVNFRAYPAGVSYTVNQIGIYRNGAYNFRDRAVVEGGSRS